MTRANLSQEASLCPLRARDGADQRRLNMATERLLKVQGGFRELRQGGPCLGSRFPLGRPNEGLQNRSVQEDLLKRLEFPKRFVRFAGARMVVGWPVRGEPWI
jgi:hypothetical protein